MRLRIIRALIMLLALTMARPGSQAREPQRAAVYDAIPAAENLRLKESPLLAEQVRQGKLPPLERRLPEHPMLVQPVERAGLYGGTWRTYHIGTDMAALRLIINYTPLLRWNSDVSQIIPGLAESWQYSTDGRRITFHLRKGLRWSDGEPFTSADLMFWWNLSNDPRVIYKPPEWAYSNGKLMKVQAPDAWTLVFEYAEPFYFVPSFMATGFWVPEMMILPAHYLKQFHPDFNPQYKDFTELVRKNCPFDNPAMPTMAPWRMAFLSRTGDRVVYERNPYYYAVDPQGRQLPYIDRIESTRVQNSEAGVLLIIGGNIDAQFRLIDQNDYELIRQFSKKNDYRVLRWEEGTAAWYAACVNWSPEDPARRELFRNKLFRRALAVAIDRNRINQIVWHGLGRPQAAAITDESWHFRSEEGQKVLHQWISEWSQYDPDLANRYLDQCGLNQRDGDGYRLYRGKPLRLMLECFDDQISADEAALIAEDWERVGIRTVHKRCVGADLWNRIRLGRFDVFLQHNSEMDLFSFPAWVFPTTNINWHPAVGRWYMTGGKEGERPEGCMAELLDIYERCKREPDLARRHQLILDAIRIHLREGPFMLGTCGRQPDLVVVKNYFHNVPRTGILGPLAICQPGSDFPEQFFMEPALAPGEVRP